jgi:hypothetical protein
MSATVAAVTTATTTSTPVSYELIFARGIPFWHHDGRLFYYDPRSPCSGSDEDCLGTYDKATGDCALLPEPELRSALASRLAAWRGALEPTERGKPITPATKPSRARRTTAKSGKSSGSAGSKE